MADGSDSRSPAEIRVGPGAGPSEEAIRAAAEATAELNRQGVGNPGPDFFSTPYARAALQAAYVIDFPASSLGSGKAENERCPMCGGLGWTLDCNDLGKPGARMVEFMPCFYPGCETSGQPVRSVCFKGIEFTDFSLHPAHGYVMAVGGAALGEQS